MKVYKTLEFTTGKKLMFTEPYKNVKKVFNITPSNSPCEHIVISLRVPMEKNTYLQPKISSGPFC